MKQMILLTILTILFLAGTIGNAAAGCSDTSTNPQVKGNAIDTLLSGSLVCGRPGTNYTGSANDRWQEEHMANGDLYDYKKGPGHKVDPRVQMGTWSRKGNDYIATYNRYTPNFTNMLQIYRIGTAGNTYSFCDGSSEKVRAFVFANSLGPCGSYPP